MPPFSVNDKQFIKDVFDAVSNAYLKDISFVMVGTLPDSEDTYAAGTSIEVVTAALQPDAGTDGVKKVE